MLCKTVNSVSFVSLRLLRPRVIIPINCFVKLSSNSESSTAKKSELSNALNQRVRNDDSVEKSRWTGAFTKTKFLSWIRYKLEKRRLLGKLDAKLKLLLSSATSQLFHDCANRFPYKALIDRFGLEDHFFSWYKLMLMHIWMVLLRIHSSVDVSANLKIREDIFALMWDDIQKRLELLEKEGKTKLVNRKTFLKLHGLYAQTLVEYDEGFLSSDVLLAGAVWRCLYVQKDFNPVQINEVINYMRGTVAYLDLLEIEDILLNGIREWKIANPQQILSETDGSVRHATI